MAPMAGNKSPTRKSACRRHLDQKLQDLEDYRLSVQARQAKTLKQLREVLDLKDKLRGWKEQMKESRQKYPDFEKYFSATIETVDDELELLERMEHTLTLEKERDDLNLRRTEECQSNLREQAKTLEQLQEVLDLKVKLRGWKKQMKESRQKYPDFEKYFSATIETVDDELKVLEMIEDNLTLEKERDDLNLRRTEECQSNLREQRARATLEHCGRVRPSDRETVQPR